MSFHLLRPPTDGTSKVPWIHLHHVVNNATTTVALNYSIVNDVAQSPSAMSSLEVIKTCPSQCKELLSALGSVNPYDSRLITFDLDQGEP